MYVPQGQAPKPGRNDVHKETNPVQQNYSRAWDLQGNTSILFCFSFLFKSKLFLPPQTTRLMFQSSLHHKTTLTSVCELNLAFGPKPHSS